MFRHAQPALRCGYKRRAHPSCLGYQHAEAALVDESCSHCGNMTIAMLRSRCLLAKRGGIPLPCPVPAPPGFGGLIRLMVRVTWGWSESFPVECISAGLSLLQRIAPSGVPRRARGVLGQGGAQHLIWSTSGWQVVDRCIGGWARFWRWRFGCAASVR